MSSEELEKKPLLERLKDTYRLVIMNNETFEEKGSYRITLLNVYIFLSTLFVVMGILVFLLVAFTPVKRYIPGYVTENNEAKLREMAREVDRLEKELDAHRLYAENVKKIMVGQMETEEDVKKEFAERQAADPDSIVENVATSDVDRQLRKEVELAEIGVVAQQARTTNMSPRDIPLEQMYFIPPINGEISAAFQPDNKHYGVDVLAARNTAIKAAMEGYVFLSDWTLETGNTIGIQHPNNIITFYKHNSALLKKVGSYVKAGEAIAIIGNTGTLSDGPHLHFELWYKGKAVDPTVFLQF